MYLVFVGVSLVGVLLGLMFWIDFRRRFARSGPMAAWIVLVAGALIGVGFGHKATQPAYFKHLAADREQITLRYLLPTVHVELPWSQVTNVSIRDDRLMVATAVDTFTSPVIYRPDQRQLLDSLVAVRPRD